MHNYRHIQSGLGTVLVLREGACQSSERGRVSLQAPGEKLVERWAVLLAKSCEAHCPVQRI